MSTKSKNTSIKKKNLKPVAAGPVVLFDDICMLCSHSVLIILRKDKQQAFRFAGRRSDYAKLLIEDLKLDRQFADSIILYERGRIYTSSDAIIRIAEILGGLYKLVIVFRVIPKSIRDALYNFIANHRYHWFGKRENCMIPEPGLSDRFLT